MTFIKSIALTAAFAALAACGGADDTAVDNADANMMVEDNLVLPPADLNMDMNMTNDMNMANDMNMTGNAVDNTADNTTNAY